MGDDSVTGYSISMGLWRRSFSVCHAQYLSSQVAKPAPSIARTDSPGHKISSPNKNRGIFSAKQSYRLRTRRGTGNIDAFGSRLYAADDYRNATVDRTACAELKK